MLAQGWIIKRDYLTELLDDEPLLISTFRLLELLAEESPPLLEELLETLMVVVPEPLATVLEVLPLAGTGIFWPFTVTCVCEVEDDSGGGSVPLADVFGAVFAPELPLPPDELPLFEVRCA